MFKIALMVHGLKAALRMAAMKGGSYYQYSHARQTYFGKERMASDGWLWKYASMAYFAQ